MDIIYLDQNHWICLAGVRSGKKTVGPIADLYAELKSAVVHGKALFPLSASHILETSKRNNLVSRTHLAETQAELSRGFVYRSRLGLLENEVRTVLRRLFGLADPTHTYEFAIAPGFLQAFSSLDSTIASPENIRRIERINHNFNPAQQYLDFMTGQEDDRRRWTHEKIENMANSEISKIQERRDYLKGQSLDTRRRVYSAIQFRTHQPMFLRITQELGKSFSDLESLGGEAVRALVRDVPTLDVETEICTRIEAESGDLNSHDLFDVQAMYTAIPYSKYIIAEKASVSRAKQARLDKKYNVELSSSLELLHGKY